MATFNHKEIEEKWQKYWDEHKTYQTIADSDKKKWYGLVEFPYPSGAGLHVGHVRSYTGMDIITRKRRREGYEVLFPIGWDAFGLPAENYAIKTGIHPSITTKENINIFRKQLKDCGFSFDFDREIDTTDPSYYKWSQWIFLKLYEKDLAYKKKMLVNWCPKDKCVLANEEVVDGACERCGAVAEKREKEQWMLAITKYAERLDKDLDDTAYLDKIKIQQRNWIGMSEGSEINFRIQLDSQVTFKFEDKFILQILSSKKKATIRLDSKGVQKGDIISILQQDSQRVSLAKVTNIVEQKLKDLDTTYEAGTSYSSKEEQILTYKKYYGETITLETLFSTIDFELITSSFTVFTTRADTLFGATYCVLAPEHPLVEELILGGLIKNIDEVRKYKDEAKMKKDIDRSAEGKEKTGVRLEGMTAINPGNKEAIPVFIADYVLPQYGTGAIMAVPAHDMRDGEFATKYNIPQVSVISPETGTKQQNPEFRKSIVALVWNKKNNTFLSINWGESLGGNLFVGGGLDDNEDVITCALREIQEETGYQNLTFISQTVPTYHNYFAHSKNVARRIEAIGLLFELNDETQSETALEENEKNKFTVEWLNKKEAIGKVTDELHALVFKKLVEHQPYTGTGILINSGSFNGLASVEAKKKITESVGGRIVKKSKLRDWVFARQRYWGEPIPLVYDKEGIMHPVHESNLPITLPQVDKYEPTDNGESPLYQVPEWVHVQGYLDSDGYFHHDDSKTEVFRRETDTMPQWAGSSWYFMRYIDPRNDTAIGDKEMLKKWLPVDWYNGGMEHTTLHLLYSRFWYKFLYDIGLVPTSEPYYKRTSQGMILGEGGVKMSKSLGNVVNPDVIIKAHGADTLRVYEMFLGPFDQAVAWNAQAVSGARRFLDKISFLKEKVVDSEADALSITHQTIKKVTEDIETMAFNTSISQMMIWANFFEKKPSVSKKDYELFLQVLAPFAPHITEEIWFSLGNTTSIHQKSWPSYDQNKLLSDGVTVAIQVLGKLRGTIEVTRDMDDEVLKSLVEQGEIYKKYVGEQVPKKIIIIKNKVINIVL